MAYEQLTKVIGKSTYRTTLLGAKQGRKLLVKLANPKEETYEEMFDIFAEVSEVKVGDKWPRLSDVFDVHFSGNYQEMADWVSWCKEVNFKNFTDTATSESP